jgi:hypothetical protein
MTVYNAAGQAVFSLSAATGQTRTGDVVLDPGPYTIRFTRDTAGGSLTPVLFELGDRVLSDPIEPRLPDPTLAPVDGPALPANLTFFFLPPGSAAAGPVSPGSATPGSPALEAPAFRATMTPPGHPNGFAFVPGASVAVPPLSVTPAPNGVPGQTLFLLPPSSVPGGVFAAPPIGQDVPAAPLVEALEPAPVKYFAGEGGVSIAPYFTSLDIGTEIDRLPAPPSREITLAVPAPTTKTDAPVAASAPRAVAVLQRRVSLFWALSAGASVLSWMFWPQRRPTPLVPSLRK